MWCGDVRCKAGGVVSVTLAAAGIAISDVGVGGTGGTDEAGGIDGIVAAAAGDGVGGVGVEDAVAVGGGFVVAGTRVLHGVNDVRDDGLGAVKVERVL